MSRKHYNKNLQSYAKENKKNMTKAEACLWKYALSKRQIMGYAFRRQRPLLDYIVDFICLQLHLIIEVDGYSHQLSQNEIKDIKRQEAIEAKGYTVLQFKDEDILNNLNQVRTAIQKQIQVIEEREGG
jgi:very-short-patch-repair endonuclease